MKAWSSSGYSRVLSSIHAAIVALSSIGMLCTVPASTIWSLPLLESGPWEYIFAITQGYFITDSILMVLYPSRNDTIWFLHHFAGFMGATLIGACQVGLLVGLHFELTELSTVFLNLCWYTIHTEQTSKVCYKIVFLCLFVTFYTTRWAGSVVLWWYLLHHLYAILALPLWQTIALLGLPAILTLLNVWWGIKLARKLC